VNAKGSDEWNHGKVPIIMVTENAFDAETEDGKIEWDNFPEYDVIKLLLENRC